MTVLALAAAWTPKAARADAARAVDPLRQADALSADPDAAVFAFSLRDHMGASVGAEIPVAGDDGPGWSLRLPMMVELHNRIGNLAPNNYWRGLLALRFDWRPEGEAGRWTFAINHESDHATWGSGIDGLPEGAGAGFYELNSVGAAFASPFRVRGQQLVASGEARLHVVSCNIGVAVCGSGELGWGSLGGELRGQLVWVGEVRPGVHWTPTAALFLDWLAPHALIRTERRLVAHLGVFRKTERRGTFDVFLLAWWGNDVGLARGERIAQTGVGVRWSPP